MLKNRIGVGINSLKHHQGKRRGEKENTKFFIGMTVFFHFNLLILAVMVTDTPGYF